MIFTVPSKTYSSLELLSFQVIMPRGDNPGAFYSQWGLADESGNISAETRFSLSVDNLAGQQDNGLLTAIDATFRPYAEAKAQAILRGA